MMNIETALLELSFHSARNENIDDPRWQNGFLGSLRPYRGFSLVEQNFHNVMKCLKALEIYLKDSDKLCKDLAANVSSIITFGRAWAVHEQGMLRRNKLIKASQTKTIEEWIDCISYAWTVLLDTNDSELAFEYYDGYKA